MVAPALALAGALYITFLIVHRLVQRYQNHKQARSLNCQPEPEGDSRFFGIIGFIKISRATKEKRWIEYVASLYPQYGRTFGQTIFTRRMVATIEPENIKAVLATQFNDFGLGTRHEEFYPLLGDGIFTLDGAGWTHSRALLRPQFTRDQVCTVI